jgi:glycosyltransferase involved in cell wall biosynthesis
VGVIIPVHNEEERLPAALDALQRSLVRLPSGLASQVVVVLDACADRSSHIAEQWRRRADPGRVTLVHIDAANVGSARAAGCDAVLRSYRGTEQSLWLATTDADSRVPAAWLSRQVSLHDEGISLWNGIVTVVDWTGRSGALALRFASFYSSDQTPIHGASLGINARTYRRAGGFQALVTGEDRALHAAALRAGATAYCDRSVPVVTSSRRAGRAPLGFAGALTSLEMAPYRIEIPDPEPPRAALSS